MILTIDDTQDFAASLATLRKLHGLTQAEVADRLAVAKSQISHYECGRLSPTLQTANRHLAALGYQLAIIPLDKIPTETGPESPLPAERVPPR